MWLGRAHAGSSAPSSRSSAARWGRRSRVRGPTTRDPRGDPMPPRVRGALGLGCAARGTDSRSRRLGRSAARRSRLGYGGSPGAPSGSAGGRVGQPDFAQDSEETWVSTVLIEMKQARRSRVGKRAIRGMTSAPGPRADPRVAADREHDRPREPGRRPARTQPGVAGAPQPRGPRGARRPRWVPSMFFVTYPRAPARMTATTSVGGVGDAGEEPRGPPGQVGARAGMTLGPAASVAARQVRVEEDRRRLHQPDETDRLVDGLRLPHHPHAFVQRRLHACAEHVVVVHQHTSTTSLIAAPPSSEPDVTPAPAGGLGACALACT